MNIRMMSAFFIATSLMTVAPASAQNPFDIINKIIKEVDRQTKQKPQPEIPKTDTQSGQEPINPSGQKSGISYNLSLGISQVAKIENEFRKRCEKVNKIAAVLPKNERRTHRKGSKCLPTGYWRKTNTMRLLITIGDHLDWLKGEAVSRSREKATRSREKARCENEYRKTNFDYHNSSLIRFCVGLGNYKKSPASQASSLGIKINESNLRGQGFDWRIFDDNHTRITQFVLNKIDAAMPDFESYVQKRLVVVNKATEEKTSEPQRLAGKKRKQEADRKKLEAYQKTPEFKLGRTYRLYRILQLCKEAREGFASVFVNDVQYDNARKSVRNATRTLKAKHKLNSDRVWDKFTSDEQVNKEFFFGAREISQKSCQSVVGVLKNHVASFLPKSSTRPKRDF